LRREAAPASRIRRVAWFVGLWVASVAALGVVAYAIRWAIIP
jgi:phage shock protein PspC (stress-responsive transcriptional regulator)